MTSIPMEHHRSRECDTSGDSRRRGTQFDPGLVDLFCECAPTLFAELGESPAWEAVVAAEPNLAAPLEAEDIDRAREAIADFTDVKSPYTLGRSRAVAELAEDAASALGLPAGDAETVRRAGPRGAPSRRWVQPPRRSRRELPA